ncbi:MAG: DUF3467 domain-containing protein [Anaerolineales bacterium]
MTNRPQRKRIHIEIPANLQAAYSNLVLIGQTGTEFFLNFSQLAPGVNKSQVHTRIVMSPTHAKLLHRALGENLAHYETQHGEIQVPQSLADQLFGNLKMPGSDADSENGESENG